MAKRPKPANDESPTGLPNDSLVPLEAILCTEELNRRPARPPDYETENHALAALVQALADSPGTFFRRWPTRSWRSSRPTQRASVC
jgi:hypothetical protein